MTIRKIAWTTGNTVKTARQCHPFYDVDILGTQEVLHNQLEDLKQRLPEYGVIGVGREDGKEKGEYSALWYKKDRFNLLDSGYFWLSETPKLPVPRAGMELVSVSLHGQNCKIK